MFDQDSANVTCQDLPDPEIRKEVRFAGEPCNANNTCAHGWECKSGSCTGNKTNEACSRNEDCVVGNYCNVTKCLKQVAKGGKCENTFQCVNTAFCNTTCQDYYSLAEGTDVSLLDSPESACKFGSTIKNKEGKTVCNKISYQDTTKAESKSHLAPCIAGNETACNYRNIDNSTFSVTCQCGYNDKGNAYCPAAHADTAVKFEVYYKSKRDAFGSKCHTLKRSICDLTEDSDFTKKSNAVTVNKLDTEQLHLYYEAGPCVRQIFGNSANFLFFSLVAAFLSAMFMF